jgi:hypothetical protein
MPLGRSPLGLAVVWFFAALFAFVIMMNLRNGGVGIEIGRWIFGMLSLFCACDLVYRVNHYHWR